MSDDDELLDVYDADGNIVGSRKRLETEAENLTTPNAIIFVFTPDGQLWLQQRAKTKRHYPGLWDTTACGAIAHGEDPVVAAERELLEEAGLKVKLTLVEKFLNSFPDETSSLTRSRLSHLYIGTSDAEPRPNEEVERFQKFPREEVLAKVKANPADFVPSMELEMRKAFDGLDTLQG